MPGVKLPRADEECNHIHSSTQSPGYAWLRLPVCHKGRLDGMLFSSGSGEFGELSGLTQLVNPDGARGKDKTKQGQDAGKSDMA